MAQYPRVISLSISPVISFLADVSRRWYNETPCAHKISPTRRNARLFLFYTGPRITITWTLKPREIHVPTLCNKSMLHKIQYSYRTKTARVNYGLFATNAVLILFKNLKDGLFSKREREMFNKIYLRFNNFSKV